VGKRTRKPEWRAALDDFIAAVRAEYGDRLEHIVLYGSRARGDARQDSDVDVLVVLREIANSWEERHHLGDIAYRVTAGSDRWDALLSVQVSSAEDYRRADSPFQMNVHREGSVLA
jgi:predicted nucleotidyltransferase